VEETQILEEVEELKERLKDLEERIESDAIRDEVKSTRFK
jgi:hypothetical protein